MLILNEYEELEYTKRNLCICGIRYVEVNDFGLTSINLERNNVVTQVWMIDTKHYNYHNHVTHMIITLQYQANHTRSDEILSLGQYIPLWLKCWDGALDSVGRNLFPLCRTVPTLWTRTIKKLMAKSFWFRREIQR